MGGGGYILGTGDEVPADAQMENLRAMVEVASAHGRH
jgi:uroporphyrinogen-III decarboxylase